MASNSELDAAVRERFEGNFLDATDVMGRPPMKVKICAVVGPGVERDKDGKGKVIDKPIIAFEGCRKRLVCGKTNLRIISSQLGKKASEWVGKEVSLCCRYLAEAFGQKNVPVVRVLATDEKPLTFGMRKHYGSATPFTEGNQG